MKGVANREAIETKRTKEISFKVYPNPAESEIFFEQPFTNADFSIIDVTGTQVLKGQLNALENGINIQTLPNGYYILKIKDEGKNTFKSSFIKTH